MVQMLQKQPTMKLMLCFLKNSITVLCIGSILVWHANVLTKVDQNFSFNNGNRKVIIIPGTWAGDATWYKPGGFFFDMVSLSAQSLSREITFFSWPGDLKKVSVLQAGKQLADVIENDSCTTFDLIAHSRGAHVGIIASQQLCKNKSTKKILNFYILAGPVDEQWYMPAMEIVGRVYNLYSLADTVQPVLGLYERTFSFHKCIVNVRVMIDSIAPTHGCMHDPTIARHLLLIHEYLQNRNIGNFDHFSCDSPGLINFHQDGYPEYQEDTGFGLTRSVRANVVHMLPTHPDYDMFSDMLAYETSQRYMH